MQRTRKAAEKLPWDDVRLFLALFRSQTLGEAATALGIDASTVSRRLAAMEESLSATLFDRGRDGIAATKAAEDLMPVAEEIEQAMARFASEAEGLERVVSGLVRIACPPDVAEVIVAPLVPGLLASHPALRIEIREPDAAAGARAEGRRRDAAREWPSDDLFLVTHRALRQVPRVRVVWDLLVASFSERLGRR
jgi:DNA-binding transcriptional LysR family regulator